MSSLPTQTTEIPASADSTASAHKALPVLPVAASALLLGIVFVIAVNRVFPVFVEPEELLVLFPPEEIAQKREFTFMLYRLLNPLVGLGCLAVAAALIIPLALGQAGRTVPGYTKMLVPYALVAFILTALGLFLGHVVMELHVTSGLGLGRTFLARWLELGFFGAGVGAAVGAATGGATRALRLAVNAAIVGVLSALVLDLIFVPLTGSKVDVLVPGGVARGAKDMLVLGLFTIAAMVTIIVGSTFELSKPKK